MSEPTPTAAPPPDRGFDAKYVLSEVLGAGTITLMGVPQAIAYALIAGLPPVAGLYAAALPAVLGSAFRSSSQVVVGPTNALSLLVGGALLAAGLANDPDQAWSSAIALALMVGVFQVIAGVLRLGSIVDYISRAVVLGYITGAGLLIGFGQLGNITNTPMERGDVLSRFQSWLGGLQGADVRTIGLALGTAACLLLMRRFTPRIPGTVVVLGGGILASWALDFRAMGIQVAGDLAPVPQGLPPLTLPSADTELWTTLLPAAFAATVLSLVESSSVARSIAAQTGEKLDMNKEFVGTGLANVAAGFTGGYPVSGSLARSSIAFRVGAHRLGAMLSGVFVVLVLLVLGPVVDLTPIASLAGLLLVVAADLVDFDAIRQVMRSLLGDRLAFLATLAGTWTLPLDAAIYLGVALSIILFLRRVRHLKVRELVIRDGKFREANDADSAVSGPVPENDRDGRCRNIRVLHVEGNLFFGAASELQEALDDSVRDPAIHAVVVRLKRARGMDYTTAGVLIAARERMEARGRHLILAGMTPRTMMLFDELGVSEAFGPDALFPTRSEWFVAMEAALREARHRVEGVHDDSDCPIDAYFAELERVQSAS
jgi:SulP family sulfate permease